VVLGLATLALVAHAARAAASDTWTRTVRPGGETWTYRFVVTEADTSDAHAVGAEAAVRSRAALPKNPPIPPLVIPANAGIHAAGTPPPHLDTRFRGYDGVECSRSATAERFEAKPSSAAVWRQPDGPVPSSNLTGGAGAAVDIEAQRAYLNSEPAGSGTDVSVPSSGQRVYFHLDYRVAGTAEPVALSRRAVIDGETFCSFTGSPAAGDYFTWCADAWVATPGLHTLRWDLDFDDAVPETDETNNTAATTWTSGPIDAVDIEAQRAYLNTQPGAAGMDVAAPAVAQLVYFHLDFRVAGPGDPVAVSRRAVLDGETVCSFTGSPTPGDYFTWCLDPWGATAGAHTLQWDLDFDDDVVEANEANNSTSTHWSAGAPDVEAQRAYLHTQAGSAGMDVAAPAVGERVYFHLDFRVSGTAGPVEVSRRALIDDQTFCSFTASPAAGEYFTWCLDPWEATVGMHTLRWDLDFDDAVPEADEANNSAATSWTTSPEICAGDCDGNGGVAVNELVTMVNVALGDASPAACPAGDADGDGEIAISDIIVAVGTALTGCV